MKERKWVYVSGPYTGDVVNNIRNAIIAGNELWKEGFFPYVPHVTDLWRVVSRNPYEFYASWIEFDLQPLLKCEAVLRIPGISSGADKEERLALEHGIVVFHDIGTLIDVLRARER